MYWGLTAQSTVSAQSHGLRLSTIGVILMIAGAVGLVISTSVFVASRRPAAVTRTMNREVTDAAGRTTQVREQSNEV